MEQKGEGKVLILGLIVVLSIVFLALGQEKVGRRELNFIDAPGSPIPVKAAWSGVIGDFNEDAHLDIVVLCPCYYGPGLCEYVEGGTAAVGILLGNGDGTFIGPTYFPVGEGSRNSDRIVTGDFNRDQHLDLTVTNPGTGDYHVPPGIGVYLLLGDGIGGFISSSEGPFETGREPSGMAAADFNQDRNLDLAVACSMDARISLLYGTGLWRIPAEIQLPLAFQGDPNALSALIEGKVRELAPELRLNFAFDTAPGAITSGDFNEDGYPDLVTGNIGGSVSVVLSDPYYRMFFKVDKYPILDKPESLAIGDFNEDSHLDIAVTNRSVEVSDDPSIFRGYVSILFGDGTGEFPVSTNFELDGKDPVWIVTADFNRDGHLDLATANDGSNDVSILLGNGEGNFEIAPCSPHALIPGLGTGKHIGVFWVGTGDFNEDGWVDLGIISDGREFIAVRLNSLGK
jgi:hypothetical protein